MDGVGGRLRARARELGLSDAEVARKAGLTATRYGHYVNDIREPDLATVVRICRVLGMRPDELLGFEDLSVNGVAGLQQRIIGFSAMMDDATLQVAVAVMQALAVTPNLRETLPAKLTDKAVTT